MTPAERRYDIELTSALRQLAQWIEPHIGKIAVTMRLAADRLEQVSMEVATVMPARQFTLEESRSGYGVKAPPPSPTSAQEFAAERAEPQELPPWEAPPEHPINISNNLPQAASPDQPAEPRRKPRKG